MPNTTKYFFNQESKIVNIATLLDDLIGANNPNKKWDLDLKASDKVKIIPEKLKNQMLKLLAVQELESRVETLDVELADPSIADKFIGDYLEEIKTNKLSYVFNYSIKLFAGLKVTSSYKRIYFKEIEDNQVYSLEWRIRYVMSDSYNMIFRKDKTIQDVIDTLSEKIKSYTSPEEFSRIKLNVATGIKKEDLAFNREKIEFHILIDNSKEFKIFYTPNFRIKNYYYKLDNFASDTNLGYILSCYSILQDLKRGGGRFEFHPDIAVNNDIFQNIGINAKLTFIDQEKKDVIKAYEEIANYGGVNLIQNSSDISTEIYTPEERYTYENKEAKKMGNDSATSANVKIDLFNVMDLATGLRFGKSKAVERSSTNKECLIVGGHRLIFNKNSSVAITNNIQKRLVRSNLIFVFQVEETDIIWDELNKASTKASLLEILREVWSNQELFEDLEKTCWYVKDDKVYFNNSIVYEYFEYIYDATATDWKEGE